MAQQIIGVAREGSPTPNIEGIVFHNGSPVAGVRIRVGRREVFTTGAEGRFLVGGLRRGRNLLVFQHDKFLSRTLNYFLQDDENVRNVAVSLARRPIVSGRVVDQRGAPIVYAAVTPLFSRLRSDGLTELSGTAAAQTDDRGEYRLFDLLPGKYYLNFSLPGAFGERPQIPSFEEPPSSASMLYPGTAEMKQAELVEVREGQDLQLKPVILPRSGLGLLKLQVSNPYSSPLEVSFGIQDQLVVHLNQKQEVNAVPPVIFAGESTKKPALKMESGLTELTLWPNHPGDYQLLFSWLDPQVGKLNLRSNISYDGSAQTVPILLKKPEGNIDLEVLSENADGTVSPMSNMLVDLGHLPFGATFTTRDSIAAAPPPSSDRAGSLLSITGTDGKGKLDGIPPGQYPLCDVGKSPNLGLVPTSYIARALQGEESILQRGITISANSEPVRIRIAVGAFSLQGQVANRRGLLLQDAFVTLLPDTHQLNLPSLVRLRPTDRTDQNGGFSFHSLSPGRYRLFAWTPEEYPTEDVPSNRHLDPNFLKQYESRSLLIELLSEPVQPIRIVIG